jgi:hypothetical protein
MNRDLLKKLVTEQINQQIFQDLMETKELDKYGNPKGSKYVDAKGVEHDEPWERSDMPDPEPEDDEKDSEEELELELEE